MKAKPAHSEAGKDLMKKLIFRSLNNEAAPRAWRPVGEMLLRERGITGVSEKMILAEIGEPADVLSLANCLNRYDKPDDGFIWRGISIPPDQLRIALSTGSAGAFLINDHRDRLLHAVLVKGIDGDDLIKINDTFDQTSYIMSEDDFIDHWGGQIVFRWYPE